MTEHKAKALLITCMDYRFIDSFYKEAEELGIEHSYDRVAIAGDIKNIVKPAQKNDAELILRQIEISKELHDIQEVIIISHQNCGAYPELVDLDTDTEFAIHKKDLLVAKKVIEERITEIQVLAFFATLKEGDHQNIIGFTNITS